MMEIFTLLKANIRYKRGSFISIFLLMIIVSTSLTAVLSVMDNCKNSIEQAHQAADTGELVVCISDRRYTGELKDALENHPVVKKAEDYRCVGTEEVALGEHKYENGLFLMKVHSHVKLINTAGTGYQDKIPALGKGEIYVTKGLLTNINGKVGDTLTITTIGGVYHFAVKGVVLEPFMGAFVIGYKQLFVSGEDLEIMLADAKAAETPEKTADIHELMIYKADACTLSDTQFRRTLNLDTGITDQGIGSLTQDMSMRYTGLFPEIVAAILTVFIIFLTVIVLIIMGHSISSGIEMDYVNLGILKSYGFTQGRIRLVFVLQYLLAEAAGAAVGMPLSMLLIRRLGRVIWPITAVVMENHISVGKSLGALGAVLLVSGLFILILTGKVGKISPVCAIAGGRPEVYFDSRLKAPILKRGLLPSLAFRQFISGRRRYGASVMVAAILVFFMMTIMLLAGALTSKTAMQSMGAVYGECGADFKQSVSEKKLKEIEKTVEEYSQIEDAYYMDTAYYSIDGEEIMGVAYDYPEQFAVSKGRAPLYENEIIITEILEEELDLHMGDEVSLGAYGDRKTYLISGIFQSMNDTGKCFGISADGVRRMGLTPVYSAVYALKEPEMAKDIADALNDRYGDILEAEQYTGMLNETYQIVIDAVRGVIFFFSIVFALAVVQMVCAKMYLQEKTDIGIYKAVGFTASGLRLQFAFRFLTASVIGSAAGIGLSVMCSARMLSVLLRGMGITNMCVEFTAAAVVFPIALICVSFFVFAFWASGRIKRLPVRELAME